MDEQANFNTMEHEGYHLFDRPHPHSPGHTRLLVAIRETPTKQHFDPESIELYLIEPNQKVGSVKLTLTSLFSGVQQICPGQIVLHDRMDKRVYFFVYGGTLEASFRNETTIYVIRSPAPILAMSSGLESLPEQLASETEALLAKLYTRSGLNNEGFQYRLTQVDPLLFYEATIRSIPSTYEQSPTLRANYHLFYEILLSEKDWLAQLGRWSSTSLNLADLLDCT